MRRRWMPSEKELGQDSVWMRRRWMRITSSEMAQSTYASRPTVNSAIRQQGRGGGTFRLVIWGEGRRLTSPSTKKDIWECRPSPMSALAASRRSAPIGAPISFQLVERPGPRRADRAGLHPVVLLAANDGERLAAGAACATQRAAPGESVCTRCGRPGASAARPRPTARVDLRVAGRLQAGR